MTLTILLTLFVVGVLASVAIHEAGHFIAARRFGMAVSDYSVGFGKPLVTYRRNGIAYRLRLLPLGGFVKIHGMRPNEPLPDEPNGVKYVERPAWQRAVVAAAGPAANVVFAWVLILGLLLAMSSTVLTTTVTADSASAGLAQGDTITAVNGAAVASGDALATTLAAESSPVTITVDRAGAPHTAVVQDPAALASALATEKVRLPVTAAAGGAASLLWSTTTAQVAGMAEVLTPEALGSQLSAGFAGEERSGDGVVSIVGVGQMAANETAGGGISGEALFGIVALIAALNIVLAAFNLIPVTPLDGGHVVLAIIEGATTKVRRWFGATTDWFLPRPLVSGVTMSAFALLIGLGLSLIALDVINPVQLSS